MSNTYNTDDYRIIGTKNNKEEVWTRSTLSVAQGLAKHLVENHGYDKAVVMNTFDGSVSNSLFVWPEELHVKS